MSEQDQESVAIHAAAKAFNDSKKSPVQERLILSNGVVLKVKSMPPMLLNAAANTIPVPPVPKFFNDEKGREEENPNHPDYLAALEARNATVAISTMNLVFAASTEIDHVPDNMMRPEDDGWIKIAHMAGFNFDPEDKIERYLAWLKSYALATIQDLSEAQRIPLELSGVSEQEVGEAIQNFPSGEERGTDMGSSIEEPSPNGNHVSQPTAWNSQ